MLQALNTPSLFVPQMPLLRQNVGMANEDKNGGPNFLRQWREYRKLTQAELAKRVETSVNMIQYLESGERGLSAKWLRRLAPVLETTSGMLLEHDPTRLDTDIIELWSHASRQQREQIGGLARVIVRTGTDD